MDRNQKTSEQICKEVEELVQAIRNYNGEQGHPEKAWRIDQQDLLSLLSQNPLILKDLSDEIKEQVKDIVNQYLANSFNGWWEY